MNRFARAARQIRRSLRTGFSEPMVYRRGDESVEVMATPGANATELTREYGAAIEADRHDWIIDADRLLLGGRPATPQDGDRLERIVGDKRLVYEAMPIGTERCARLDPSGIAWRIHTKLVKTES